MIVSEIERHKGKEPTEVALAILSKLNKYVKTMVAIKNRLKKRVGWFFKSILLIGLGFACSGLIFYLFNRRFKGNAKIQRENAVKKKEKEVEDRYEEKLKEGMLLDKRNKKLEGILANIKGLCLIKRKLIDDARRELEIELKKVNEDE